MTKNKLFLFSLIFLTILSSFSCATTSGAKQENSVKTAFLSKEELCPSEFIWSELEPGFYETSYKVKKLGIKWHCVKIDLTNPKLKIIPGVSSSKKGFSVKSFARKNKTTVTFNTTPFDVKNYEHIVGVVKSNGILLSEPVNYYCALGFKRTENGYEAIILPKQNEAEIEKLDSAFGGFFQILHENQVYYNFEKTRRSRSGCGISENKKKLYILISTSGGNLRDWNGLNYPECAIILQAMGCTEGMQFDGGHSTSLCIYNKEVLQPFLQRKVPALLGFSTN